MAAKLTNIIVRKGKAYVPVLGQSAEGPYVIIEPVYTVDLTPNALAGALERVMAVGHPLIRTPLREITKRQQDPLLRATGVRSWTALARGGQSYALLWDDECIRLVPSRHDAQGRFVDDPARARLFPLNAPSLTIAAAILEDVRSRPELGGSNRGLEGTTEAADSFAPFGYKMGWLAVRGPDVNAVASALRLHSARRAGWGEGIDAVYRDDADDVLFVSPPVQGWILVVGPWTMGGGEQRGVRATEKLACKLSDQFGEAQAFATHRVVEYHHWMRARQGKLERSFAYLGETGAVLRNIGKPTPVERALDWFSLPEEEWRPDEEDVMTVAGAWSLNPTSFDPGESGAGPGVLARAPKL